MAKELSAQELYNEFYYEACNRARIKGQDLPNEVEVFQILVKKARVAMMEGDAPPDFMEQLAEVKPQVAIARELAARDEERYRALKSGVPIDIEDLFPEFKQMLVDEEKKEN